MARYGVILASLAACGGGAGVGGAVIRVGGSAITTSMLAHWTSVLAGGRPPGTETRRGQALRRNAAQLLISAAWSTGEAEARGLKMSAEELQRGLRARERADFPGGSTEMQGFLRATGETVADLELEVKATWALSQLRRLVAMDTPPATRAQLKAYYQNHLRRFAVPERREIVQTESKTEATAILAKRKMAANKGLLKSETETLDIAPHAAAEGRIHPAESAIATAKLHTLEGPVKQRVDYYVFEVKRIFPAHEERLDQVSTIIASQLTMERRAHALAAFERAWVRKWSAKTSCRTGYVAMPCRQYRGPRNLELGFGLP